MTILAGVFSPNTWTDSDQQFADAIQSQISRADSDERQVFFDGALYACKVDVGAYGEPAWLEDERSFSTLVGRPMLGAGDRAADLRLLSNPNGGECAFDRAHGSACALLYDRSQRMLRLVTDPLGNRPFFVAELDGRWVFSSSLRLFRGLPMDLVLDLDGIAELSTLGYFLLDHTPYAGVRGAGPAECWSFDSSGMARRVYLPWSHLDQASMDLDAGVEAVHSAFESAITAGLEGGDGRELVSLSGSLNSRLIAAALNRRGLDIQGVCSASADAVSSYCARAFSDVQGIPLSMENLGDGTETLEQRLGQNWVQSGATLYQKMARPRVAWVGKGGSVGMGAVVIDERYAEMARWQDLGKLVDDFMGRNDVALPPRIIYGYSDLEARLRANLIASIQSFDGLSRPRAFMAFISLQHQRRHFVLQREDVDLHRMELHVPFCSPQVARAALSLSIEDVRDFKAFLQLINRYYPEVLSVPWRSTPGHLKCDLPMPVRATGRFPWIRNNPARRKTLSRAWELVRNWQLPPGVLDRTGMAITCAITETRLKNGLYSLNRALVFSDWLRR